MIGRILTLGLGSFSTTPHIITLGLLAAASGGGGGATVKINPFLANVGTLMRR